MEGGIEEPIFGHEKLDVYHVSIASITLMRGVLVSLAGIEYESSTAVLTARTERCTRASGSVGREVNIASARR